MLHVRLRSNFSIRDGLYFGHVLHAACARNQRLHRARVHLAAFRIHRFWREVCYSPAFAWARRRLAAICHHTED